MAMKKDLQVKRESREKGIVLPLTLASMAIIIPMMGLAVDAGALYMVRIKLSAAADAAALAAARSLNLGLTVGAQTAAATTNATNFFNANFPPQYLSTWGSSVAVDLAAGTTASTLNTLYVTTNAQTTAPPYFMNWFNVGPITVKAGGQAARRNTNIMLVLDRSGSMNSNSGCSNMRAAAKMFTGEFSNGRDSIGMITFADTVYVETSPVNNFQNVLGYTNSSGTGAGLLDNIVCNNNTGIPAGVSVGYNELYRINQPSALNVMMFMTDGLPNSVVIRAPIKTTNSPRNGDQTSFFGPLSGPNTNPPCQYRKQVAGIWKCTSGSNAGPVLAPQPADLHDYNYSSASTNYSTAMSTFQRSTCQDGSGNPAYLAAAPGQTANAAWDPVANPPNWTGSASPHTFGSGSYLADIPIGPVGDISTNDTSTPTSTNFGVWKPFAASTAGSYNHGPVPNANGCRFNSNNNAIRQDVDYIPDADVFGNQLDTGYFTIQRKDSVTDSVCAGSAGNCHIAIDNAQNVENAAFNAADFAANQARANATLPVLIYAVGLGGTSGAPPDYRLLQRMTNDSRADSYHGSSPLYGAWAGYNVNQPQGIFIFSTDPTQLGAAFLEMASAILRLSK